MDLTDFRGWRFGLIGVARLPVFFVLVYLSPLFGGEWGQPNDLCYHALMGLVLVLGDMISLLFTGCGSAELYKSLRAMSRHLPKTAFCYACLAGVTTACRLVFTAAAYGFICGERNRTLGMRMCWAADAIFFLICAVTEAHGWVEVQIDQAYHVVVAKELGKNHKDSKKE